MASQSGIAELIGRLKKDGVDAGESEKQRIIEEAQAKAEEILAEAKRGAEDLLSGAKTERDKLAKQLDGELRMAARDFAMRLSDRVKAQVIHPAVEGATKDALNDEDFLKACLPEVCAAVAKSGEGVELVVSPETKDKLEAFFTGELKRSLGGGEVTVRDEQGMVGFSVKPSGESFTWDFTLESMTRELGSLVDPALRTYFALDEKTTGAKSNGSQPRPSA
jgi:V/A-type H+-transporting ATPase subunit E